MHKPLLAALIALSITQVTQATELVTEKAKLTVSTVTSGLKHPWGMTFLPDGRMLVTERNGGLLLLSADGKTKTVLQGLPDIEARGQGGLLDVVLSPDFSRDNTLYFSFSEPGEGGSSTAVAKAELAGDTLKNVSTLFSQQPKVDSRHHFGSRLVFDKAGNLFITLGDRGSQRVEAQNLANHIGTVVRVTADGKAAAANPFTGKTDAKAEIWSYGHRNIQGAALHPVTGQLWTHEHGPQGGDELNIDEAGKNYGWPVITYGENYGGGKIGEGTHKEGMEQPVYKWVPSIATAGFIFYTGDKFPQWKNNILLASLREQTLVRLTLDGDKITGEERLLKKELGQRFRSVVQGPDGLIYVVSDESKAKIYQLSPQ